jgi:hypothetical protein
MEETLNLAMVWAQARYPDSSTQHKCAFANSVAYLVTGYSGGFGGTSLREHLVSWSLGDVGSTNINGETMTTITPKLTLPGKWQLEAAIAHAAPLCFDAASNYRDRLIQIQEREHCFDDNPADLDALRGNSI